MGFNFKRMDRRAATGAVRFSIFLLLAFSSAGAERLLPLDRGDRAPVLEARAERWFQVREMLGPPHAHRPTLTASGDRSEPLRVMVCRLAFDENRDPHLTTIPEDGGFMLDPEAIPEWRRRVDPPPHDRLYFNAHMRALAEYIRFQSYEKVDFSWDLLPAEEEPFRMSDIADYGPGEGGYWTLELLEAFVRSALDEIDASLQADPSGPRFADYDVVMIFHAGSDLQNDIALDSPNDLPSFNIFFGDPEGPHLVDGGETELGSVLLLPETTIQDVSEGDPLGALNAVTAHEFTHQLGTVDTYNTLWFWPVVGYWDLMDSGHQLTMGLQTLDGDVFYIYGGLPTSLAVWHKEYLGWIGEEDGSLQRMGGGEGDFTLTASGLPLEPEDVKALRVDLSDSEYFLLENRQELLTDGAFYMEQDDDTGVILFVADDVTGENLGMYDLFIPQSGLLAWHVAEQGLDALWDINVVNPDGDWHFWLTEADGLADLGNPYSYDWRGSETDPFYFGNNTDWGLTTVPSTRLKDGSASGFALSELVTSPYLQDDGAFDATLTFHASLSGPAPGFPRDDRDLIGEALDFHSSANSLMPMGEEGLAYGMAVLEDSSTIATRLIVGGPNADTNVQRPLPRFEGQILTSGFIENFHADEDLWFIFTPDSLQVWRFDEGGEGLVFDRSIYLEVPILAGPLATSDFLFWIDVLGGLYMWESSKGLSRFANDREDELLAYSPPTLWRAGEELRILLQLNDGLFVIDPDENYEDVPPGFPLPDGRAGVAWIRALDRDGDGADEVIWVDRSGYAGSWSSDFILETRGQRNDPASPENYFHYDLGGDSLITGPALGDMDGDGRPEIFLSTRKAVYRFATPMHEFFPEGQLYTDWPLRPAELLYLDEPMQVGGPALLADMTGDGLSELVLFGHSGQLIVADEQARPILGTPRSMAEESPADLYAVNGWLRAASWKGFLLGFDGNGDGSPAEWGLPGGGVGRTGRWERRHPYAPAETATEAEEWILYPNPAGDHVILHHPSVGENLTLRMELFDMEGERRLESLGHSAGGPFEARLELGDLASGIYLLRAELIEAGEVEYHFVKRVAVLK